MYPGLGRAPQLLAVPQKAIGITKLPQPYAGVLGWAESGSGDSNGCCSLKSLNWTPKSEAQGWPLSSIQARYHTCRLFLKIKLRWQADLPDLLASVHGCSRGQNGEQLHPPGLSSWVKCPSFMNVASPHTVHSQKSGCMLMGHFTETDIQCHLNFC